MYKQTTDAKLNNLRRNFWEMRPTRGHEKIWPPVFMFAIESMCHTVAKKPYLTSYNPFYPKLYLSKV